MLTIWPGQDGIDHPFQADYARLWDAEVDGLRQVAEHAPDFPVSIEYKPSEPRSIMILPNVSATLLAIAETGAPNLGVTLDFGHVLEADTSPAMAAALVGRRSRLLGLHLNDGYGQRDDGLMVGTRAHRPDDRAAAPAATGRVRGRHLLRHVPGHRGAGPRRGVRRQRGDHRGCSSTRWTGCRRPSSMPRSSGRMPWPLSAWCRRRSSAATPEQAVADPGQGLTVPDQPRVCVVGSLHFDIMVRAPYLPRTGETLIGEAWWWKQGGKGGNQAVAAARHGARVAMIGCLGDDEFGARLRERLADAGVDVAFVRTVAQGSGMSVAIQQEDGDYAAVVVSGANRDIDRDADRRERRCHRQLPRPPAPERGRRGRQRRRRARWPAAAGATVILNAAPARPLGGLAGLVDVLVVNTVEAEMLGAGPVDDLASATTAARTLRSLAPTVIVTAGDAGVVAASDAETLAVAAHPVVRADAHGAGDVFVGALAARLADGATLAEALHYANAAAALHVGTPDADRDALGPADVWRLLAGHAAG